MEAIKMMFKFLGKGLDVLMKYFKLLVLLLIVCFVFGMNNDEEAKQVNLAKLYLRGPILQSDEFREQIENIKQHPNIQGALLIIDSPGGGVGASIEIANLVQELRESMPVIAYVESVMASGGYYGGMYSDQIIANRGAMIGSIGVVLEGFNLKPLLDKIGITPQSLQMGEYKRIGTPFREWNLAEKKFLQDFIAKQYNMFVSDVLQTRKLKNTDPNVFANGKIFTAKEALDLGLIDFVGSQNQAIQKLCEITQVQKPIWLEKSKTQKWLDRLSNASLNLFSQLIQGRLQ